MDLDKEIVAILQRLPANSRPMTINDFARRFGAHPRVVLGIAQKLVEDELAQPSMVNVNGKPTLHALLPR